MSVTTTFRSLSGGAKLRLFGGFLLLLSGISDGSGMLIVLGIGLLASFAWTAYRAYQINAELEPFPMPADMRATAEAMVRPIDPMPKRLLPPHELSSMVAQVAATPDALKKLIADKPPAWPWAVFTSVMVQRRNAVQDRLRAVASGYQPRPGGNPLSGQAYFTVASAAIQAVTDLLEQLDQFVHSPAFKGGFAEDQSDDYADAGAIVSAANRLMDYHEKFLTQAETCLQTPVQRDVITFVQDTGMFTLIPLIAYDRFITDFCARIGEAQDLLPYTGPETVIKLDNVTMVMDAPDGLMEQILKHMKRVTQ